MTKILSIKIMLFCVHIFNMISNTGIPVVFANDDYIAYSTDAEITQFFGHYITRALPTELKFVTTFYDMNKNSTEVENPTEIRILAGPIVRDSVGHVNGHIKSLTLHSIEEYTFDMTYMQNTPATNNTLNYVQPLLQNEKPTYTINIGDNFYAKSILEHAILHRVVNIKSGAFADSPIITLACPQMETVSDRFVNECKELFKLIMPKLKTVGDHFAYKCVILPELILPKLQTVGDNFANSCENLTKIELPELTQAAQQFAFLCVRLISLSAPKLQTVGSYFAYNCDALTTLSLPLLKTARAEFARHCSKLKELELPSLEQVDNLFVSDCKSLIKLDIPALQTAGSNLAASCTSLKQFIAPELIVVERNCLQKCESLTELSCPKLTIVGQFFAPLCKSLININLKSLTTIGYGFADQCSALQAISVPKVTNINDSFAHECPALKFLDIRSAVHIKNMKLNNNIDIIANAKVKDNLLKQCPNANIYIISEDVKLIGTTEQKGRVTYITTQQADKISEEIMNTLK